MENTQACNFDLVEVRLSRVGEGGGECCDIVVVMPHAEGATDMHFQTLPAHCTNMFLCLRF